MGLLARYRRPWIVVVLCLLATPMLVQAIEPSETISQDEARILQPPPKWLRTIKAWQAFPRELDRFLADHFGLRAQLVRARGLLGYAVQVPTHPNVLIGRDNQLFYAGDNFIEQLTGQSPSQDDIARFINSAAQLQARLPARTQLLVAIPPNSASILPGQLPAWAAQKPTNTALDLMLERLKARGIATVDLRPPLIAASFVNPVYRRTDTHWNQLGALVAYNAVVTALRRPQWLIDPDRVLHGFDSTGGGDLARMLGLAADVSDLDARIDLSAYKAVPQTISRIDTGSEFDGDLVETGRDGPTIIVIGDSFTKAFWRDYFSLHVGRYIWMHHEGCAFSVNLVQSYAPDVVILAPTERFALCYGELELARRRKHELKQ
jgi:alginate O-acetyltransferase complex protein AlgJ